MRLSRTRLFFLHKLVLQPFLSRKREFAGHDDFFDRGHIRLRSNVRQQFAVIFGTDQHSPFSGICIVIRYPSVFLNFTTDHTTNRINTPTQTPMLKRFCGSITKPAAMTASSSAVMPVIYG